MSSIIYSFIMAPSMQCELNKIKQCTSHACTLTFVFDIKLNLCKFHYINKATHQVGPHIVDEVLQGSDAHRPQVHRHHRPHTQEELLHLSQRFAFFPAKRSEGLKRFRDFIY